MWVWIGVATLTAGSSIALFVAGLAGVVPLYLVQFCCVLVAAVAGAVRHAWRRWKKEKENRQNLPEIRHAHSRLDSASATHPMRPSISQGENEYSALGGMSD